MERLKKSRISFLGRTAEADSASHIVNYDTIALNASTTTNNWSANDDTKLLDFVTGQISGSEGVKWTDIAESLSRSPQDCFARYHNVLSANLKRSEWDQDETLRFMELVSKYGPFNWAALSAELGTNRSPLQCLQHFQKEMNDDHIHHSEWSAEEDLLLSEGVKRFGQGKWQEIAATIPRRSASQCMFRWKKALESREDIVIGRWTELEERKLYLLSTAFRIPTLESSKHPKEVIAQLFDNSLIIEVDETIAVQDYDASGPSNRWIKISELIPGKSEEQCREKWTNNMDPTINSSPFSDQETRALQMLVQQFGEGQWTKICKYLPGRTDAAVRRKWMMLKKRRLSEI